MLKEKLSNLLETKKLIALMLTGVFAYLAVAGEVTAEQYMAIFSAVIGYYFGQSSARQAIAENK